ncbi:hypothetical protein [Emticicia sp. 21SJ11W-3]|uniref:hypothetical protein n=1 Tax=Emticicia sp. 21SJ11W-3 TaxID=2916755 RepID=UPI00209E8BAF|nr:hypothetical protein [Emticicia sp. 21SJ11W-3]UTA67390.1 hypothetical protein MB380_17580 [Emticicia sp. 21SJ11W-3]
MKFFKSVIMILLLFGAEQVSAQTFNNLYATIDVYNNQGQNPHDFAFSYDVINGQHTCNNNFEVISNLGVQTNFKFEIYMNSTMVYTGNVVLNPYGKVFFDNAFSNCYSKSSKIRIVIIP